MDPDSDPESDISDDEELNDDDMNDVAAGDDDPEDEVAGDDNDPEVEAAGDAAVEGEILFLASPLSEPGFHVVRVLGGEICHICRALLVLDDEVFTWDCPNRHIAHSNCAFDFRRMFGDCPECAEFFIYDAVLGRLAYVPNVDPETQADFERLRQWFFRVLAGNVTEVGLSVGTGIVYQLILNGTVLVLGVDTDALTNLNVLVDAEVLPLFLMDRIPFWFYIAAVKFNSDEEVSTTGVAMLDMIPFAIRGLLADLMG